MKENLKNTEELPNELNSIMKIFPNGLDSKYVDKIKKRLEGKKPLPVQFQHTVMNYIRKHKDLYASLNDFSKNKKEFSRPSLIKTLENLENLKIAKGLLDTEENRLVDEESKKKDRFKGTKKIILRPLKVFRKSNKKEKINQDDREIILRLLDDLKGIYNLQDICTKIEEIPEFFPSNTHFPEIISEDVAPGENKSTQRKETAPETEIISRNGNTRNTMFGSMQSEEEALSSETGLEDTRTIAHQASNNEEESKKEEISSILPLLKELKLGPGIYEREPEKNNFFFKKKALPTKENLHLIEFRFSESGQLEYAGSFLVINESFLNGLISFLENQINLVKTKGKKIELTPESKDELTLRIFRDFIKRQNLNQIIPIDGSVFQTGENIRKAYKITRDFLIEKGHKKRNVCEELVFLIRKFILKFWKKKDPIKTKKVFSLKVGMSYTEISKERENRAPLVNLLSNQLRSHDENVFTNEKKNEQYKSWNLDYRKSLACELRNSLDQLSPIPQKHKEFLDYLENKYKKEGARLSTYEEFLNSEDKELAELKEKEILSEISNKKEYEKFLNSLKDNEIFRAITYLRLQADALAESTSFGQEKEEKEIKSYIGEIRSVHLSLFSFDLLLEDASNLFREKESINQTAEYQASRKLSSAGVSRTLEPSVSCLKEKKDTRHRAPAL